MYYLMYQERGRGPIIVRIDRARCTDCGLCLAACKEEVFLWENGNVVVTNGSNCNGCRKCETVCIYDAICFSYGPDKHNKGN